MDWSKIKTKVLSQKDIEEAIRMEMYEEVSPTCVVKEIKFKIVAQKIIAEVYYVNLED